MCCRLKERETEAIVLGQKLQLQTEELAQLQQNFQTENTSAEMLQQAHADLVSMCVPVCDIYTLVPLPSCVTLLPVYCLCYRIL